MRLNPSVQINGVVAFLARPRMLVSSSLSCANSVSNAKTGLLVTHHPVFLIAQCEGSFLDVMEIECKGELVLDQLRAFFG